MENSKEIRKLKEDKSKAKQKQNFKEVILLCNYLGDLFSNQGEYERAIEQHKEELEYGRKLNDNLSIAVAYRRIGECYSELSEFENALNFQNKYLSIVEKLKDTVEIQRAYATLGRTYFMQFSSDPKKHARSLSTAETAHLKALNLTDRLKDELKERDWAEMRCRALLNLGLIYDQKDDEEQCSLHFRRAINLARNFGFKEDLHRCEISLATFYSKIGDYSQAIKMFDTAILSAKQLKNKLDLLETLMGKGHTLIQLRDYDNARHCFKKAFFIYKSECDENFEAKRCFNLVKQIVINIRELRNTSLNERKIKICDKLGDLFADLNCYTIAIEYYTEELNYAQDENYDKSQLAPIYLSLGQTYLDNKQYTEALYNFKKEIDCNQGKPKEELLTSLKIIEVKCHLHRNNEEIIDEFNRILDKLAVNNKLKRIVYKEYLDFLKDSNDFDLYSDLIKQIKSKLDELNKEDNISEQFYSQSTQDSNSNAANDDVEVVLSDVSELTSDSETEENEELSERRSRRAKKGLNERRNEKGETPLHRACIEGNINEVESLIEKGHKINPRDNCGWLPIHEASNHGFAEIVDLLIKHKAWLNDPGGKGCDGTTPIHDACTNGHLSVIRILLRAGANVTCVDYHNNTPLDCLNGYLRRAKDNLTAYEKKDFQLLVNEMKEEMTKKGFNFNDDKKSLKRPFSSIDKLNSSLEDSNDLLEELSKKIDKNRARSTLDSPPRKTNRPIGNQPSTSNLRKNVNHGLNDFSSTKTTTTNRTAPRIESLIDENNLILDDNDWLEDDMGVLKKTKSKPITDPFESNRFRLGKNKNSPIKYKTSTTKSNLNAASSNTTTNNKKQKDNLDYHNLDLDYDMDCSQLNSAFSSNVNFENDYEDDNLTAHTTVNTRDDDEQSTSSSTSSLDVLPLNECNTNTTSNSNNKRKTKRKQTKINNYFSLDAQTMKSTGDEKRDDVILLNGNGNSQTSSISNQSSSKSSLMKASKLKVRVHIDGMTLLVPLPADTTSIGWLMNETIERYYSFKKIRPIIQLKTMDGALLSGDDQVVDVLTNMEVKVEIDSFKIKPINELYGELCEQDGLKMINELDYEFRISMASGCLNLRNCFLNEQHFKLVLNSLKMQTKIKILDLSYSNLLKLDDNCNLMKMIFNLSNLEVLNLECTGLSKQQLIELTKQKTTKLISLNLNYNLLFNCVDLICDLIENNSSLTKLSVQYTDLTEDLIVNLRLNQIVERRLNFQIYIDTLRNTKNFKSSSFVSSCLDVLEANELDYREFNEKLFIS